MTHTRRSILTSLATLPLLLHAPGVAVSRDGGGDEPKNKCEELRDELRSLRRRLRRAKSDARKSELQADIDDVLDEIGKDC